MASVENLNQLHKSIRELILEARSVVSQTILFTFPIWNALRSIS